MLGCSSRGGMGGFTRRPTGGLGGFKRRPTGGMGAYLDEASSFKAEGDDRDAGRIAAGRLSKAAEREEEVLERVARLRLEQAAPTHGGSAEPSQSIRRLPVAARLGTRPGGGPRLAT